MTRAATYLLSCAFIALLSGVLYIGTLRGVLGNPTVASVLSQEGPTQAFELSPERGRFAHVMALAETGQYALAKDLGSFVFPDVGWYEGRFYSFFAPGMAFMALPFYLFGAQFGLAQIFTFGFVSFIAILNLLLIYFIGRKVLSLPNWAALASAVIFGFGSTSWSYAVTMYQHQLTVFFLLSTFYAAWKYAQHTRTAWLWASWVWLGYGLALTIDYPNAFLLSPVLVYLFVSAFSLSRAEGGVRVSFRASFALTAVLFCAVTALHLYHNQKEFGSWKRLSGSIVGYKTIQENKLDGLTVPEITQSIANIQEKKGNVVKFFSEDKVPNSFGTLLFSKDRGLFFYGPIFILGILGLLIVAGAITVEISVLIALMLVNLFLYSSWGDPWGGWAYGTRYLIPSMSILSIFAGLWLAKSPKAWVSRIVAIPLFAYSCAVALVGVLTTNAVPPRVEADYLHMKYNYLHNIDFLRAGKSGSFFYNTYLASHISLVQYFEIIFVVVVGIFSLIVLIGPFAQKKSHD